MVQKYAFTPTVKTDTVSAYIRIYKQSNIWLNIYEILNRMSICGCYACSTPAQGARQHGQAVQIRFVIAIATYKFNSRSSKLVISFCVARQTHCLKKTTNIGHQRKKKTYIMVKSEIASKNCKHIFICFFAAATFNYTDRQHRYMSSWAIGLIARRFPASGRHQNSHHCA